MHKTDICTFFGCLADVHISVLDCMLFSYFYGKNFLFFFFVLYQFKYRLLVRVLGLARSEKYEFWCWLRCIPPALFKNFTLTHPIWLKKLADAYFNPRKFSTKVIVVYNFIDYFLISLFVALRKSVDKISILILFL